MLKHWLALSAETSQTPGSRCIRPCWRRLSPSRGPPVAPVPGRRIFWLGDLLHPRGRVLTTEMCRNLHENHLLNSSLFLMAALRPYLDILYSSKNCFITHENYEWEPWPARGHPAWYWGRRRTSWSSRTSAPRPTSATRPWVSPCAPAGDWNTAVRWCPSL